MTQVVTQPHRQAVERLDEYAGRKGYFIKAFFADGALNMNGWGVTPDSMRRDLSSGLDKSYYSNTAPIIMMPTFGHPPDTVEDMIREQEPYRVGNFVDVGTQADGTSWVVAELTDERAQKAYESGEVIFVSPSVHSLNEIHLGGNKVMVTRFRVNHLAMVKNPAYGFTAQIIGKCVGTEGECKTVLQNVQASAKDDFIVEKKSCGATMIHFNASEALTKCITEVSNSNPDLPFEQMLKKAVENCLSESLKTSDPSEESMAGELTDEEKKRIDELQSKLKQAMDELDEEKEKSSKQAEEINNLKKDVEDFKASLQAEVKKPLAEKIASLQVKLGKITQDKVASTTDELMKRPLSDLKDLSADYDVLAKKIEQAQSEANPTIRYPYHNASKEDKQATQNSVVLATLRGRMGI